VPKPVDDVGYVVLFILVAWVTTSLWLTYRTGRELSDQGFKPWAKGWYWKNMWRHMPEPEQKIYGRHNGRQWLLICCVVLVFVLITLVDTRLR
jgi:hypothetical protein